MWSTSCVPTPPQYTPGWTAPRAIGIAASSRNWPRPVARASRMSPRQRSRWLETPGRTYLQPKESPSKSEGQADLDMPPAAHVGYYLLDHGRAALEARLGYRPSPGLKLARWILEHPSIVYIGSILLLTLLMVAGSALYAAAQGGSALLVLLVAAVTFMPALAAAMALVDWVVTLAVPPRILPKLDLSGQPGASGIPDSCRTMVVVPAMLGSANEVASLVQQIEQHYLRNPDHNLYFALLTDFGDAAQQHMPGDAELFEQQRAGIAVLNERYAALAGPQGQVPRSACSTVSDAGTRKRSAGSAGSANAANSTS